ncbi:MAG TPA: hypothetical protein VFZ53_00340 [Polyangiaceae bacterium]
MTTIPLHSPNLDAELDDAVDFITKQRARRKFAALSLLGALLLALLGATYAMYARAPASSPPSRAGTSH